MQDKIITIVFNAENSDALSEQLSQMISDGLSNGSVIGFEKRRNALLSCSWKLINEYAGSYEICGNETVDEVAISFHKYCHKCGGEINFVEA